MITDMIRNLLLHILCSIFLFFVPFSIFAWEEHALGIFPSLENSSLVMNQKPVQVSDLSVFLIQHEKEIEALLGDEEVWASAHLENYKPLPEALAFRATGDASTVVSRFVQALRINPDLQLKPYLQADPRHGCKGRPVNHTKLTIFQDESLFSQVEFCTIKQGDTVSVLDIISSASDEPDHGMDVGLFENNHIENSPSENLRKSYNFGVQPFGDDRLEYGSQPPFHMGFYHEAGIIYAAAPFLKETYPEYRVHQFRQLALFALKKGDRYWGYRFLGWALHYITDLTQPYHATVLPGVSTFKMLWINFLAIIGFDSMKNNTVNLVSNRHTAIEKIQQNLLTQIMKDNDTENPLLLAFADHSADNQYPKYSATYLRDVVAKESNERASTLDQVLVDALPAKYVSDPSFEYTAADKERLIDDARHKSEDGFRELTQFLIQTFRSLGAHSRNFVESAIIEAGEVSAQQPVVSSNFVVIRSDGRNASD